MLEAKAKDQGHKRKCSPKKKKKVFTKIFQAISTKKRFPKNFSSAPQNFNIPKNSAVLEPRTGQFSRTRGQGQGLQNLSSRTPPLAFSQKKKGLRRNPKVFSGRNQKFKRFFRPKTATFSSLKPALKSRWEDA